MPAKFSCRDLSISLRNCRLLSRLELRVCVLRMCMCVCCIVWVRVRIPTVSLVRRNVYNNDSIVIIIVAM